MKNILVIQSRNTPELIASEQEGYRRAVGKDVHIVFVSSLDTTIEWKKPSMLLEHYDAVIFGGSGDFDFDGGREDTDDARIASRDIVERVRELVLYAIENDFPLLGICYGHQIVSESLGVKVVHDHGQKKVGSHEIVLTDEGKKDAIFSELSERFIGQYMHKDSLSECPSGATLLANSDSCRASALRFGTKVYTMQFHPELRAEDLLWKLETVPGYLPEGIDPRSIVQSSEEASKIIPRFLEFVVG